MCLPYTLTRMHVRMRMRVHVFVCLDNSSKKTCNLIGLEQVSIMIEYLIDTYNFNMSPTQLYKYISTSLCPEGLLQPRSTRQQSII